MASIRKLDRVVRWCADECERQRSGEQSVAWLFAGWQYAHHHRNYPPKLRDILALGRIVEPRHNLGGLRRVGVRVGWDVKLDHELVPKALDGLIAAWDELDPVDWFKQYEDVHPFRDGNGRTGSLLLNWKLGTLPVPVDAPDLWSGGPADQRAARARVQEEAWHARWLIQRPTRGVRG